MKPIRYYKFIEKRVYKTASSVRFIDSKGYEIPWHNIAYDTMIYNYKVNGKHLDVYIKRPRITYADITVEFLGPTFYHCSAKVNGAYVDMCYMYYTKKEAKRKFYQYVNDMVA